MRRRAFLAATAAALAAPRAAAAQRRSSKDEVGVLRGALELEQVAGFVYGAGVAAGLLDRELAAALQNLRGQESEHEAALAASLEALGSAAPAPPASAEQADAALERLRVEGRLGAISTRAAFLALAEELELAEIATYGAAVADLDDVRLIQTCASILGAEGAHLVVIRQALGRAEVPRPLEPGRP